MIDRGKHNVLGVMINALDYDAAVSRVIDAAKSLSPLAVTALAVHGVMTGHTDAEHRSRLNAFDLVVPDGQPVRWALNSLHGTDLKDRVYGPELMLRVLAKAETEDRGVYLYGSTQKVLDELKRQLGHRFPQLRICGSEPSKFRTLSSEEKAKVVQRIRDSGAAITFVGLGCPRQEVWAYEYRDALSMPVLAVGAAFDFHAGTTSQAPRWMQDRGLEWVFRFGSEPRRLWKRYAIYNPWFVGLLGAQKTGRRQFPTTGPAASTISYG
jgi:exopolysaccharide biosynthesis WecB/TagA/CpsF family protein